MSQEDFDYQLNALKSEIMKIVQQTNVIYDKLSDLNYDHSSRKPTTLVVG